jgi:hypothetical protein
MSVLDLLATDEFAAWFHSLADGDAEDVATALEVLGSLPGEQFNPSTSDLLLWYQRRPGEVVLPPRTDAILNTSDAYHRAAARIGRALMHLESDEVSARIARLPAEVAAQVRDATSRIRSQTSWRRGYAMLKDECEAKRVLENVDRDYRAALESMSLQEPPGLVRDNGLRQLLLTERPPGMRILYGVNAAKQTALLVLGEHLDRRAYGSSVRGALSRWEQFLADESHAGLVHTSIPSRAV